MGTSWLSTKVAAQSGIVQLPAIGAMIESFKKPTELLRTCFPQPPVYERLHYQLQSLWPWQANHAIIDNFRIEIFIVG